MSSEEAHDLDTPEETSAPAETIDTEGQAYDLLFGNKEESETAAEGSAEDDVATESEDSSVEETETSVEGSDPEASDTEDEVTETEEDPEGTDEGIAVPESFRDIKRDSLQTAEGKAVYDVLAQAYKSMEADYTKKSQAIAGAEGVIEEHEDALRAIFRQGNINNPSHSDMLEAAVGEFVALRTDADFAQALYQQLGQLLGDTESDPETTGDVNSDLEQFKNEVRGELQARDEQEQIDRLTQQLQQEWDDVQSNEEFSDFSEDDWQIVVNTWSASDEESSAYAHAKALKARYDAIAESKAKEAEEKQKEYLKKKAQQPKVGAGGSGQNAQQTTPKPKSWDEADDIASKMLGL